ncbi:MAG: hypothetical protein IJ551_12155 [Prevotella sp.]|nr:hypothetical protein [Prevotella sp.]
MMSRKHTKRAYIYIISTAAAWLLPSFGGVGGGFAQTLTQHSISTIAKSDPLIITGAVGTQNTYYHSSIGSGYRSPWANSLYANLNVSVYGISMPFAFYYSNNNSSFSYPHLSFHIDPTYKNWRGHFGRSNMALSSYLMNMSFNGIGLEYTSQKLRFGAFYGELRNAINDDPLDPGARTPQYRRLGWGFKVGYGAGLNYLDLYLLRAYDQLSSVSPEWQQRINPQDNVAVAVKGGLGVTKWLSLRGNLAWSAFSSDKRAERIHTDQLDRWDKIFEARYTSMMRIAGDISANCQLSIVNCQLYYKMVQPDYTTLGLYYTSNNYQSLGINASTNLFNRIALTANFSGQEDNITRNQLYTTRGFVYSASASAPIVSNLQLSAGYNGYRQLQSDGKAHVNDTTRVNRIMHSVYVTPSLTLDGDQFGQVYSLTANFTQNKDLNQFATGLSDVTTWALGLSHALDIKAWEMSVTTSLSHQTSKGYQTRYTSDVLSLSTGRSFLKEKNLSTSATVSLCYNDIQDMQRNLSMGVDLSAGYTLAKVHQFSFSAGFNKYSDTNISADRTSMGTTEVTLSVGYNYTFSLLKPHPHTPPPGEGSR